MFHSINTSFSNADEPWISELPQLEPKTPAAFYQQGSLSSGAKVQVRRVKLDSASTAKFITALHQLHQISSPYLAPLVGTVEHEDEVWLLFRPITTVPLAKLANSGLEPATGVAIGLAILQGVATLHKAGLGVELETTSVAVDAMGTARLEGDWMPHHCSEISQQQQIVKVGWLMAKLLDLSPQTTAKLGATERQSPALAAAVRALIAGRVTEASSALELIMEAAGGLSAESQLEQSRHQLAKIVKQLAKSGDASPHPANTHKDSTWRAKSPPTRESLELKLRWLGAAIIGVILLVVVGLGLKLFLGIIPQSGTSVPAPASPTSSPELPRAPLSAGQIKAVSLSFDQPAPCQTSSRYCRLRVDVQAQPLPANTDIAWVFIVRNACDGKVTQVDGTNVSTDGDGWTSAYSSSIAILPQGKKLQIAAQTTQPAVASSQPLTIGESC